MKRCPECFRSYADETQNFCLDDGAWLTVEVLAAEPLTVALPHGAMEQPEAQTRVFDSHSNDMTISISGYQPTSIAVLPFAHRSSDPDDEYFCDGLAEELINELAQIDELKVVARTSAFSFKGKNVDVAHIGSVLNVKTILEGSVRKSGNRLRITAQLINVDDGYHLWSNKYDLEMRDLFDVQDEITLAIVSALKVRLFGKSDENIGGQIGNAKGQTSELEGYQAYLRGRFFFNKFTTDGAFKAIEFFEQAIALDPELAAAYAGLAYAHIMTTEMGPVASHEAMPRAKEAALKALSLDETSADAHSALAMVLNDYDYDFIAAEEQFKRAIELSPNNSVPRQSYGMLLAELERHDEAERQFRKALEVDPLSVAASWVYSICLFLARRYDESLAQAKATLELDPAFAVAYLSVAFVYQMKGDYQESVEAYARCSEVMGIPENTAFIRRSFESGWNSFMQAMVGPDRPTTFSSYIISVFATASGDLDRAFSELESALANREPHLVMLKADPRQDGLREDPRFAEMIKRIGFPL
jgi:adenylate cyclase